MAISANKRVGAAIYGTHGVTSLYLASLQNYSRGEVSNSQKPQEPISNLNTFNRDESLSRAIFSPFVQKFLSQLRLPEIALVVREPAVPVH